MYSSSVVLKHLVLVPTLIVVSIQLLLICSVSSLNMTNSYLQHKCFASQGKYKQGSVYEKHLKSTIEYITSTSDFSDGFEIMSASQGPDFVSLIFQCRGDSYGPKCRSCFATALSEIRGKCPKYKGRIIWYDLCFLEISGIKTSGKIDYENNFCMSNSKDVTSNQDSFHLTWMALIGNLTSIATQKLEGKQVKFYAAGEKKFGKKMIYGMVQCTKDLSSKGCQVCMGFMLVHFQNCYYDKQGGRVFGRSCSFRFELYPFVNTKDPKYLKI